MEQRIKRISEAYSIQPYAKQVDFGEIYDFESKGIYEIKREREFYIGYDIDGNKLFAWRADAVNIEYFKPGEYVELKIKNQKDNLSI